MDEVYFPKKDFEDLLNAVMADYKRELKAIIEEQDHKGRRNDDRLTDEELADWTERMLAETTARIGALCDRYKPRFQALADEIIKFATGQNESAEPEDPAP